MELANSVLSANVHSMGTRRVGIQLRIQSSNTVRCDELTPALHHSIRLLKSCSLGNLMNTTHAVRGVRTDTFRLLLPRVILARINCKCLNSNILQKAGKRFKVSKISYIAFTGSQCAHCLSELEEYDPSALFPIDGHCIYRPRSYEVLQCWSVNFCDGHSRNRASLGCCSISGMGHSRPVCANYPHSGFAIV